MQTTTATTPARITEIVTTFTPHEIAVMAEALSIIDRARTEGHGHAECSDLDAQDYDNANENELKGAEESVRALLVSIDPKTSTLTVTL